MASSMIESLERRVLFSTGGDGVGQSLLAAANAAVVGVNATMHSAPVITSPSTAVFDQQEAGSFTIDATNGGEASPIPAVALQGTLPKGLKFKANKDGTATISGTPAAGTVGEYTLIVGAHNIVGSIKQTLTLEVQAAPVITSGATATFPVGTDDSVTISTTGFPLATISEIGNLPSGISLQSNGDGTGTLSGTASTGTGGVYDFTVVAANGRGMAMQDFVLTVDEPYTITNENIATFAAGQSGTFDITTTGFPVGSITASSLPKGLTLTDNGNGTATISGTPAANTVGLHAVTISVKAGSQVEATQSLKIQIDATPFSVETIPATSNIFDPTGMSGVGTTPIAVPITPGPGQVLTFSSVFGTVTANGAASLQAVTSLVETNSTITATVASTNGIAIGSTVTIAGASPSAFNGSFLVTAVTQTTFTYYGGTAFESTSVTSLTEANTTVTATVASTTGLAVGSTVTIAGATPSQYNGTFTITQVLPTTFQYQDLDGLSTPATGTITAAPTADTATGAITESPEGGAGVGADGYTTFNNIPATTDIASQGGISGILDNNGGFFLVGLFLDGTPPMTPPAILNVSNWNSMTKLSPQIGQTFFIGNGQTAAGVYQKFNVPSNATVLYLGFADANDAAANNLAFHGTPFYTGNSGSLVATLTIGPS